MFNAASCPVSCPFFFMQLFIIRNIKSSNAILVVGLYRIGWSNRSVIYRFNAFNIETA